MSKLITPKGYKSTLDLNQTEQAIKLVKDTFQLNLSSELARAGVLEKYQVRVLGSPVESIIDTEDRARFAEALFAFGYRSDSPQALLEAFRLRFRPGATRFGPTDLRWAEELAARFPVDRGAGGA